MRPESGQCGARLVTTTLDEGPELVSAVATFACDGQPAILESVVGGRTSGRWSVFAADPVEVLLVGGDEGGDPLADLAAALARYPKLEHDTGLPCVGGWIGYVSYEAGARLERVFSRHPAGASLPLLRLALYDTVALFEHLTGRWHLLAVDWPAGTPVPPGVRGRAGLQRPPASERLTRLQALLGSARRGSLLAGEDAPQGRVARTSEVPARRRGACPWEERPDPIFGPGPGVPAERPVLVPATPQADWTFEEYVARVQAAQRYISAGDIYQVNLTQRFVARTPATPLQLYLALRRTNPADYAAFLSWDHQAVISSSPELFLDLHDGRVVTRPIKGTRPRTGDARGDARRRRELADSEKDRAELNMIVDLLRNDLGRVCAVGTVQVLSAGDLETHPTVFHRVATIVGRLRPDADAVALLRACCPGGSITGAPKIRAMQIIDELETVQRGVYCGSIGYIGLDGNMAMNIAIRTLIYDRGGVHLHAGGAIVADSDPLAEYEETLAKAVGMFRALAIAEKSKSRKVEKSKSRNRRPHAED